MTARRVTVVIPTCNRPATLSSCLARLAPGAQTAAADAYEVIVTDDGNVAATGAVLARDFPWVIHVEGPRRGPAANRNRGARAGTAEWIAFADDDVLPDPSWIASLLAASDGVDVVEGRTTCREGLRSPRLHAPVNETGGWWWSCNLMVRRSAFDRLGGFDERFRIAHMEDVDLRERARAKGVASRFAPGAVVDHPPRRERWGTAWADVHRAELLYAAIHAHPLPLGRALRATALMRARSVARAPFSADGVSAALSAVVEVAQMVVSWGSWQRDARTAARATP